MHQITWQPGEHGKGVVSGDGDVHAFNEDEYFTHDKYLQAHPEIENPDYFYISPSGKVDITNLEEGHPRYETLVDTIKDSDPHFFVPKQERWDF